MSQLFEPSRINQLELPNRFVRSATWEGLSNEDGSVTTPLIELLCKLARGGVGLIIPGHTYVSPEGQASFRQLGIYHDGLISGLQGLTQAIHDLGGKTICQLAHAGAFAYGGQKGGLPLTPSLREGGSKTPKKEMDRQDIQKVVQAFVQAARRAKEAGFDGVQIHAAHGYLLSQFLSPAFNKRSDAFGGPIENRARIVREVHRQIRSQVGSDFPVLIKMNCQDFFPEGLTLEDAVKVALQLQEDGLDAIELSGGIFISKTHSPSRVGINSQEKEAYFLESAAAFKKALTIPLILVGGIRSLEVAERIFNQGQADYFSFCRPLIREPGLINRWKSGDLRKARCLSDNQCFEPARAGEGIYCVVEKREQSKEAGSGGQ